MQIWALSLLWASDSFVQYLTSIYGLLNYYELKQKAVLCSWHLDANKGCRHASNDHRNNRIIVGYDKGSERKWGTESILHGNHLWAGLSSVSSEHWRFWGCSAGNRRRILGLSWAEACVGPGAKYGTGKDAKSWFWLWILSCGKPTEAFYVELCGEVPCLDFCFLTRNRMFEGPLPHGDFWLV